MSEESFEWINDDATSVLKSTSNNKNDVEYDFDADVNDLFDYVNDDDGISEDSSNEAMNAIGRMVRDIRGRLFRIPTENDIQLAIGQVFKTTGHFKEVLKEYCIQEGFWLRRIKNEGTRVTRVCGRPSCQWRIHTSLIVDKISFCIRSITTKEHTCIRILKIPEVTSD